jgi:hypothetical protein
MRLATREEVAAADSISQESERTSISGGRYSATR